MEQNGQKTVLWWGRFDPLYSRNRVYEALFKELGWNVVRFNVHLCSVGDVEASLRGVKTPDILWLPCFRQRDVAAACRWAKRRGVPVVFDPLISAWDKKVLEQQKWGEDEGRARRLLKWESGLFNRVDWLLADTSCHAEFFHRRMQVPMEHLRVLYTGTDESVFKPMSVPPRPSDAPLRVLYHGCYIPLHGTEYIVEAARLTQHLPIQWSFLGWGKYKQSTEEKARGISNITFLDRVPYTEVPAVIQSADIVLGVFGTTEKASRVIGNKVYEAMACGRPVINEYCTGYPEAAKHTPSIQFIPPGDPKALAEAVEKLLAQRDQLPELNREARRFFEENLSMRVVKGQLAQIVDDVLKGR
jgi:glycosyltransferase involved in cell wall biosynthesis